MRESGAGVLSNIALIFAVKFRKCVRDFDSDLTVCLSGWLVDSL